MTTEATCGEGLAHHAELLRLIGQLLASIADNLSAHLRGLVSSDAATQHERRVYLQLEARHREAAAMLDGIGAEMAAQHDMPMGEHDVEALSTPAVTGALEGMIRAESELAVRLQRQLEEHRTMFDAMRP